MHKTKILTGVAAVALAGLVPHRAASAFGAGEREVGEFTAGGMIFKDTMKVTAFKDPKVEGVTLYISHFQRPVTEIFTKFIFGDPSSASISCAKTSEIVKISKDIYKGKDGEEVFDQSRSLIFKSLRVRRIYDAEEKTLIYVSYSTRVLKNEDDNKSRFKSSISTIRVDAQEE